VFMQEDESTCHRYKIKKIKKWNAPSRLLCLLLLIPLYTFSYNTYNTCMQHHSSHLSPPSI
jgi:hypothetical protein